MRFVSDPERFMEYGLPALRAIAEKIVTVPDANWDMEVFLERRSCGTVGCALGHSTNLAAVKRAGLIRADSLNGLSEVFGITVDAALRLFYPGRRASQAVVAKRIRNVIKGATKECDSLAGESK